MNQINRHLIIFFANSRISIFLKKLVGLIVNNVWKESIQEKGKQSTQFSVQSVKINFKFRRSIDSSNDFYFFIVLKRLVITKNSVVKIQNLVVNHESRPVKSNPGVAVFYVFQFVQMVPSRAKHCIFSAIQKTYSRLVDVF